MLLVDVIPGIGLDDIRFGWTRQQVEDRAGPPEKITDGDYGPEGGGAYALWYYFSRGITFSFNAEDGWRLGSVEVDADSTRLNGLRVMGLRREELLALLAAEEAPFAEEQDQGLVAVDDWGLNFWLEQDRVTGVQWNTLLDDDDEIIWPGEDV